MERLKKKQIVYFKKTYEKDMSNIVDGLDYIKGCLKRNKTINQVSISYLSTIENLSLIMDESLSENAYVASKAFMHFYELINEFLIYLEIRKVKDINQGDSLVDTLNKFDNGKHDS